MWYAGPKDALLRLRDDSGIERPCMVDFICREYGRTLIREYHYAWIGEKYGSGTVQIAPQPTYYIQQQLDAPNYPPEPKPGGQFRDDVDHFTLTVYFDDLILQRATGRFEIRRVFEHPFGPRTDKHILDVAESRRHVPEFYIE